MNDGVDFVPREYINKSADVVGIGMRGDDDIYRAVIPWHHARKFAQHTRIRSAVDEHLSAAWGADENSIALADIKERNSEKPASIFAERRVPDAKREHEKHEYCHAFHLDAPPHSESISHPLHEPDAILQTVY